MSDSAWSPPPEFEEYVVIRLLGRGAMGQVYLAHDSLLERSVAVKFVHAEDPAARTRFFEEARAIARLQHPNVVAIYRVAEISRHPYLVSEYVRGRTLDQLERPLPWRQVLDIALDLTRGLAAAHRCGVLHRDVKPANAMLGDDGAAKLLDFGLARVVDVAADGDDSIESVSPPAIRASERASSSPSAAHLGAIDATISARHTDDREAAGPLESLDQVSDQLSDLRSGSQLTGLASGSPSDYSISRPGGIRPAAPGTPLYMAPEVWRGEPATRRSDLYSLGILLYELLAGTAPHRGIPMAELGRVVRDQDIPLLATIASGVDPALAAIVDRLVERDSAARFASADALLVALEECAAPTSGDLPDGNPYRGLAAFDATHGALFFGRLREIRELVDRVRTEAFVVVGGDSGTGKSSLCRAGALPWLAAKDGWSCVDVIPGRHPVRALAAALAPSAGLDEAALAELLRVDPSEAARAIYRRLAATSPPGRLLLFVDQLEELLTLSDPEEAKQVSAALAALAVRTPSMRVLACCRSDFLSRAATLPGLGDEMSRRLYFLAPLTGERIREVIVRPAAAKGVAFESEALIDALVEQTEHAPGGLPLLQFTLAELWDARDVAARTIRAESLAALGGVGGALTRHADRLLSGLRTEAREAARRILLRLVTAEGTRARRPAADLFTADARRKAEPDVERAALEALVRGRVVVANDAEDGAYEIAHEALLASWSTLQGWLRRGAADQAARARVEQAAAEWDRMGRSRELLWGRRQLADVKALERDSLAPRDAAFLAAAERAILRRRVLGACGAAALAIAAVAVGLQIRSEARRELSSVVANELRAADDAHGSARRLGAQRDELRRRAFQLFDDRHWPEGEAEWTTIEELTGKEEAAYRSASSHLESALRLAPKRDGLQARFEELTLERLRRAERDRHRDLAEELAARVASYDAVRLAELGGDARIALDVSPPGTAIWSEREGQPRVLLGREPLAEVALPPGSAVLVFESPGHVEARLPVLLARGEALSVRVALPAAAAAPRGMVYVPAGRFLFGAEDTVLRRGFLNAVPIYEVRTEGYFIGRHEVTIGEWIEYLADLPPEERARRTPRADSPQASMALTELGGGRWRLTMKPSTRTYTAETGEPIRYEQRTKRAEQDWTKFPVAAVSYSDAGAYAAWLDRTGRIPGARLCDEYEWERAARGADGRIFPSGKSSLGADDANIDTTYGRKSFAFGPDEVGSHPASRSPVGADDMAGNVWEWTRSVETPGAPVTRGGGWYNAELSSRTMNRERGESMERHPWIGVRLCATPR